jgi:hypothetical protein
LLDLVIGGNLGRPQERIDQRLRADPPDFNLDFWIFVLGDCGQARISAADICVHSEAIEIASGPVMRL